MKERVPGHCTLVDRQITDEQQGAAVFTRAWVSRLTQRATRHGSTRAPTAKAVCPLAPRSAGWNDSVNSDSKGPKLARAGVQSQQSAASSASPGRGRERGHQSESRQRTVSQRLVAPRAAGRPEKLPKWREESRLASGRLCRYPPDTPCEVPRTPGTRERVPSTPAPTSGAPWREATRPAARGARARVRHVLATQLAQLRERGSALGVESQVT